MYSADDSNLFPSPGGDAFDSVEGSDDFNSESETLAQIEETKSSAASKKKRKAKKVRNISIAPKKTTTKKKSSVTKEARPD
jgi:hypothetical protein